MRIFLILLFCYFIGEIKNEEAIPRTKIRDYCTISKIWNCTLKPVEVDDVPVFVKTFGKENELKSDMEMQFVYQTPVSWDIIILKIRYNSKSIFKKQFQWKVRWQSILDTVSLLLGLSKVLQKQLQWRIG